METLEGSGEQAKESQGATLSEADAKILKQLEELTSTCGNSLDERYNGLNADVKALGDRLHQLEGQLADRDEQIRQLNKKIESLTYIIEEDNRNIKMVAKHIIDQANSMKVLKEEIYRLTDSEQTDTVNS